MPEREDVGYKPVTCTDCGATYTCTPANDYYNFTTATDGCCFTCLLARNKLRPKAGADVLTNLVPVEALDA